MTYIVPKSQSTAPENRFEFSIEGVDGVHSVPLLKYLPVSVVDRLSDEPTIADLLYLFGTDDDVVSAVRALDADQLTGLMGAWTELSGGLTAGKSSPSDS